MSAIDRLMGLLQLVELSGGQIDTRIKIQKEAFLLAVEGLAGFRVEDFQYHHYGPYSRSLSNALQLAVSSGFLTEVHEGGEDKNFTKYSYKLTSSAAEFLNVGSEASARMRYLVDLVKDLHWRVLELVATVRFLELDGVSNREEAISRTLELKPDTRDFLPQARDLLSRI